MLDFVKVVMMSWLTFFCSLQRKSRLGLWEQIIGGKTTATFIFLAQRFYFLFPDLWGHLPNAHPFLKLKLVPIC